MEVVDKEPQYEGAIVGDEGGNMCLQGGVEIFRDGVNEPEPEYWAL
jgi:hypothetical protein